MQTTESWKIIDVLKEATHFLESRQIESARRNAETLLASVLNLSRVELYLQFDRPLTRHERELYKPLLRRRGEREPLQYITETTEFYGLPFTVNSDVLIPRPETEILVEKAVEIIRSKIFSESPVKVLDIGTGSGNISIALAKMCDDVRITAIDCNPSSLKTAVENAKQNQVPHKINFQQVDILKEDFSADHNHAFDFVLSNPPYISRSDMQSLAEEIRAFEPEMALEAGEDGLDFYRRFTRILPGLIKPDGHVLMEIGSTQGEAVRRLFSTIADEKVNIIQDLSGLDRIVSFQISGENGKS